MAWSQEINLFGKTDGVWKQSGRHRDPIRDVITNRTSQALLALLVLLTTGVLLSVRPSHDSSPDASASASAAVSASDDVSSGSHLEIHALTSVGGGLAQVERQTMEEIVPAVSMGGPQSRPEQVGSSPESRTAAALAADGSLADKASAVNRVRYGGTSPTANIASVTEKQRASTRVEEQRTTQGVKKPQVQQGQSATADAQGKGFGLVMKGQGAALGASGDGSPAGKAASVAPVAADAAAATGKETSSPSADATISVPSTPSTSSATSSSTLSPKSPSSTASSGCPGQQQSTPEYRADLVGRLENLTVPLQEYEALATERNNSQLVKHIRTALERSDAVLSKYKGENAWAGDEKVVGIVKLLEALVSRGREWREGLKVAEKLRAELDKAKEKLAVLTKERNELDLAAAKALPKSLYCFNLQLTVEWSKRRELRSATKQRQRKQRPLVDSPELFHYAMFSDNVIAASVVVASLDAVVKEDNTHVLHLVTDAMNHPAMMSWFARHTPSRLLLDIKAMESYTFLNASYCPVLRQLQAKSLKDFYFSQQTAEGTDVKQKDPSSPLTPQQQSGGIATPGHLKFKNPKYLSMMNHARFYLPEMYPTLNRVVFLDDDIVVQKDLSPLFELPMDGNVNAAVLTCQPDGDFHRLFKYLNFSHPFVAEHFDPRSCGWAYGMNVFDLQRWRELRLTEVYHKYQNMNEHRTLWQLGTLPPGLMTFYNLTLPLDPHWHVLGLGYDRDTRMEDVDSAAVIHWNGNWKPWLDTAIKEFRGLWTKHVNNGDDILQRCNFDFNSISG